MFQKYVGNFYNTSVQITKWIDLVILITEYEWFFVFLMKNCLWYTLTACVLCPFVYLNVSYGNRALGQNLRRVFCTQLGVNRIKLCLNQISKYCQPKTICPRTLLQIPIKRLTVKCVNRRIFNDNISVI